MPMLPVPSAIRFQPVDADEVAARLEEALGGPAGLVPGLAGPKVYPMADLLRRYLRARGKHRPMLPVRPPGKVGPAYRGGENLSLEGPWAAPERTRRHSAALARRTRDP
jgi:uncharacterized protein YbjT (DUF2867 family)